MSNTNGVAYRDKSMNGIITLSDGDGTTISGGTITTNSVTTINFETTNLNVNNIQGKLQTDTITLYTNTTSGSILMGTGIDPAVTIKIGNQNCDLQLAGMTLNNQSFEPSVTTDPMTVGSVLSSGQLTLGSTTNTNKIGGLTIINRSTTSSLFSDTVNYLNNLTTGRLNLATGLTTGGSVFIGTVLGQVNLGNWRLTGNSLNCITSGVVSLFISITITINIGTDAYTISIGGFNLLAYTILTALTTVTVDLFTTLTTGLLNIGGATGIRLSGNITKLYTTLTTPTASQIGYTSIGTGTNVSCSVTISNCKTMTLGVGVWLLLGNCNFASQTATNWCNLGIIQTSTTTLDTNSQNSVYVNNSVVPVLQASRIITITSGTQVWNLNFQSNTNTTCNSINFTGLRIA